LFLKSFGRYNIEKYGDDDETQESFLENICKFVELFQKAKTIDAHVNDLFWTVDDASMRKTEDVDGIWKMIELAVGEKPGKFTVAVAHNFYGCVPGPYLLFFFVAMGSDRHPPLQIPYKRKNTNLHRDRAFQRRGKAGNQNYFDNASHK
jgi:hypothetical protein